MVRVTGHALLFDQLLMKCDSDGADRHGPPGRRAHADIVDAVTGDALG
jgi:hypothetical protein